MFPHSPMKILYLDLLSGIDGDMFIAALLDLGVDAKKLERELKKLKLYGYHLHIARGQKSAIAGVKFDVHMGHEHDHEDDHQHHHDNGHHHGHEHSHEHPHQHEHHHDHAQDDQRNFAEIKQLISRSKLSAWVKEKFTACRRMKSTFTKSARWIPLWTLSAPPSPWNCSANRACLPRRLSRAPAGLTAPTGVFPCPHRRRWQFSARGVLVSRNARSHTNWSRPPARRC